jgi:O-antigen ligase
MERPLLGWGYTDEGDNIRLVADKLRGMPIHDQFMASGLGPHNSLLAMFFENGALFALAYLALLFLRARKTGPRAGLFDVSLAAYIAFMSADAMAPGGVTFLGFYLGACLLSPILNETESA